MLGFRLQHFIKNQCTCGEMSPEDGIALVCCWGCWGEHPRGSSCTFAIFRRSPIVKTAVEPLLVVIGSIPVNGLTGIGQVVKPFSVEAFITKLAIETLPIGILPGTSGLNEEGLNALALQPGLESVGDKFRPVVTAQVVRRSILGKMLSSVRMTEAEEIDPATSIARQ